MADDDRVNYSTNRKDYIPDELLPLPLNWNGHEMFQSCPNNQDKIWVLTSGGYILYDKIKAVSNGS